MLLFYLFAVSQQFIGLTLLAAFVGKLSSDPLQPTLIQLGFRSPALIRAISKGLPWVECSLGLALVFNLQPLLSLSLTMVLLVCFSLTLSRALLSGIDLNCRCFGALSNRKTTWWTVARNGVLMLITLAALWPHLAPGGVHKPGLSSLLVAMGVLLAALALGELPQILTPRSRHPYE